MNQAIRYVLMVIISEDGVWTVGVTKKRGPKFLLNRICFPGGKIESGESARAAATREAAEETDLQVPENAWREVRVVRAEGYELHVLAARLPTIFAARQLEEEPVWHLAIPRHMVYAQQQPAQYAPDFLVDIAGALAALRIAEPVTS